MTQSILFVCLGNICRSPTAEGIFRYMSAQSHRDFVVDSAGTSNWHVGDPPYGPMQKAALSRGYDLSPLRARQFKKSDFDNFDLILAMDEDNLKAIEALRPAGSLTPVKRLLDYAPEQPLRNVPDPYYSRDFDQTIDLVEIACAGLLGAV